MATDEDQEKDRFKNRWLCDVLEEFLSLKGNSPMIL